MPVTIPDALPAKSALNAENIFVMPQSRAVHQDIRPLELAILNLMPNKIETELQLLRLLSSSPLQVNVDLVRLDNREHKHTPIQHMDAFYRLFSDIQRKNYDGLIVTGAPLGALAFEDVDYWRTLTQVLEWAKQHVTSSLFLCWAAHAALYFYQGIDRQLRDNKLSGVYKHKTCLKHHVLTRGFDDVFYTPHSRVAEVELQNVLSHPDVDVLASSKQAGLYLASSRDLRQVYVTGHPEYDTQTLAQEYRRDLELGLNPALPEHYFPDNNPKSQPQKSWRSHGYLLFSNWLNYCVYQQTPYDLNSLSL